MTTAKRLAAWTLVLVLGGLLLASAAHDHPGEGGDHCAICAAAYPPATIVAVASVLAPCPAADLDDGIDHADEHHAVDDLLPSRAPPLSA